MHIFALLSMFVSRWISVHTIVCASTLYGVEEARKLMWTVCAALFHIRMLNKSKNIAQTPLFLRGHQKNANSGVPGPGRFLRWAALRTFDIVWLAGKRRRSHLIEEKKTKYANSLWAAGTAAVKSVWQGRGGGWRVMFIEVLSVCIQTFMATYATPHSAILRTLQVIHQDRSLRCQIILVIRKDCQYYKCLSLIRFRSAENEITIEKKKKTIHNKDRRKVVG